MSLAVKTAAGPTILLQSGHYFDLLDAANSRFTLGDIAHGLAQTCRFAGQCRRFYSVAEHSWHASFLVPDVLRLAALMHDAAEAFIGDVTRPLKSLLPEYRAIEKRIEAVIAARFGLGDLCNHPEVKRADLALLAAEQAALMPAHADSWACLAGIEPAKTQRDLRWPWSAMEARQAWIDRLCALVGMHPLEDAEHASEWWLG